jgi:predicted metal-dependent hydrolase
VSGAPEAPEAFLETLHRAIRQTQRGEFFDAHETFEILWRSETDRTRRDALQGLIHLAVACHHHQRSNVPGTRLQLRKGLHKLRRIDLEELESMWGVQLRKFVEDIERRGPDLKRAGGYPRLRIIASVEPR